MISAKVEAFDIDAVLSDTGIDGPSRSRVLAQFAREQLADAQQVNRQATGRVPPHISYVDGSQSMDLDRVRPDGTIVFEFELALDVVEFCWNLILEFSPILTGRYMRSHLIFADGRQVSSPRDALGADEVIITSVVPYARKLEGSSGHGRYKSRQAPDGIYQAAQVMAARRFSNIARIKFGLREPIGGATSLEAWARKNAGKKQGRRQRSQYQKNVRQPALTITFR